jgi:hypothetical protein
MSIGDHDALVEQGVADHIGSPCRSPKAVFGTGLVDEFEDGFRSRD